MDTFGELMAEAVTGNLSSSESPTPEDEGSVETETVETDGGAQ